MNHSDYQILRLIKSKDEVSAGTMTYEKRKRLEKRKLISNSNGNYQITYKGLAWISKFEISNNIIKVETRKGYE
jgi:predicted transcriptional regulator